MRGANEKNIYKYFKNIYKELKAKDNERKNIDKILELVNREFEKIINVINGDIKSELQIKWLNFWDTSFNLRYFSEIKKGSKSKFRSTDADIDKIISKDIYFYKSKKYDRYIQSSRKYLSSLHMVNEIFLVTTRKNCKLNYLTVNIHGKVKIYKKLKDGCQEKENKYFKSYLALKNKLNDNATTFSLDTNYKLPIKKRVLPKLANWIFWIYNLYPNIEWSDVFYIDGLKPNESKLIPFRNENDNVSNYHCNMGVSISGPKGELLANIIARQIQTYLTKIANMFEIIVVKETILKKSLRTAIISILIDSYAHNISAHSLSALKWWIEQRHNMLNKRIKVGSDRVEIKELFPKEITSLERKPKKSDSEDVMTDDKGYIIFEEDDPLAKTTLRYYEALGLTDSTYNAEYYSLFDYLQFADIKNVKKLFQFSKPVNQKESNSNFHPRFPVPIDYALYPFFRFLTDKGAFWSGVTRDMAFGGESKTWYKILWEDFANNPLYLGTIAKSEGITKLNINIRAKTKDGNWLQGKFVTIDMSVIDYEEKLSQSPTLESDESLLNNTVKEDDCKYGEDCSVKYENYSKYAFVKLGKCFKGFRVLLDDEENFRVFLPGGVVGEHALFTIFENTIRNIKHYKDPDTLKNIQKNGIDLWISIEEYKLGNKDTDKEQLFKVGVWLGHETNFKTKEETKDDDGKTTPAEYLLFTITENTLKPILDESTGTPRMGGNSQDKACAAMLFNNKFMSTENRGSSNSEKEREKRDREYYPWIKYATEHGNKEYALDVKYDTTKEDIEILKQDYASRVLCNGVKGYLKKYFYLWRGEDALDQSSIITEGWENPARARFLVSENGWSDDDIIKCRKDGVIRIVEDTTKPCNTEKLNILYKTWLKKWINNIDDFTIDIYNDINQTICLKYENDILQLSVGIYRWHTEKNKILYLSHGDEKQYHCNVRSHGIFWSKFFRDIQLKQPASLGEVLNKIFSMSEEEKNRKMLLMYEMWETILTKVVIFDNRIYQRLPLSYSKKEFLKFYKDGKIVEEEEISRIDMLKNQLALEIFGEEKDKLHAFLESQKTKSDANYLIMHLSFIEKLKDNNGVEYSEETLHQFITDKLEALYKDRDNFIFVVTSGRGRDKWRKSMETNNKELEKFTIFKPVESLLSALEQGISYNDHFDIKYNLLKVLFGN